MTAFLVDTNCLLSYVTERSPAQQEAIAKHVESAARLDSRLIVLPHVVSEFVYVVQSVYGLEAQSVKELLSGLLATPGMDVRESFGLQRVLELWPATCGDYGDAVMAAAAIEMRLPVLTFDRAFARQLLRAGAECELLR